ncbi:prepilin-type N-terminal cleavage/methylation domain-containing protein [Acidiferrobacter sp.]|uniref:prepilin-type N-terminal cleavage/methylation domain-containing protein n=1 Tax=Acidiferrobacter sp. TaxID=1872107 RepID=UPI002633C932|nr:prepilin-type N-terminal cleavage/methylation domain-containing protein [Acidiferrobacter sp.]
MSPSRTKGFTLIELMVAMAIGALLVLAAMILYVPVSRSLVDQGIVGQQTLSEAVNYDFDVMNTANAGYGIANPQLNTDAVLVTGTGPGSNTTVLIPSKGSAQGNGIFWDWSIPAGGAPTGCAGLQVIKGANSNSGNERLVYYEEAPGGSCTATALNTASNWDVETVLPSVAQSSLAPITVTDAQDCDLRGSQIVGNPVLHPLVTLQLPIPKTLTGGFFAHQADQVPVDVCLHNLP